MNNDELTRTEEEFRQDLAFKHIVHSAVVARASFIYRRIRQVFIDKETTNWIYDVTLNALSKEPTLEFTDIERDIESIDIR